MWKYSADKVTNVPYSATEGTLHSKVEGESLRELCQKTALSEDLQNRHHRAMESYFLAKVKRGLPK